MSDNVEFPALSFSCPQLWAGMAGNERTRFCEVCQKNVHNLSMMNAEERRTLLASTGESPCVAYFKHVNGTPIDVTALCEGSSLKRKLTQAALVTASAMGLASIGMSSMALMEAANDQEAPTTGKGGCGIHMMVMGIAPPSSWLCAAAFAAWLAGTTARWDAGWTAAVRAVAVRWANHKTHLELACLTEWANQKKGAVLPQRPSFDGTQLFLKEC